MSHSASASARRTTLGNSAGSRTSPSTKIACRCSPEPQPRLRCAALLTLAATLLGASHASAAPRVAEPTAAQVELVEQGVEAGVAGDHEHAIELFEGAIELGELNILYLNLGRAQARLEQCHAADASYTRALLAPPVASPDAAEVHQIIARYRQELAEACTGTLELRCTPDTLDVSIDGGVAMSCTRATAVPLSWGAHEITWRASDGIRHTRVHIEPDTVSRLALDVDSPAQPDTSVTPGWLMPVGWSSLALGVVLVGGGIVVDTAMSDSTLDDLHEALDDRDTRRAYELSDDLDAQQSAATGLYISGAALTALGVGLLVAHYTLQDAAGAPGDEATGTTSQLTPWVHPGQGGGLEWRLRW